MSVRRPRRSDLRRNVGLAVAVAVLAVVAGLIPVLWTGTSLRGAPAGPLPAATPAAVALTSPGALPGAVPGTDTSPATSRSPAEMRRLRAERAIRHAAAAAGPDTVSVAATNLATGLTFSAGASSGMWTASTYKLFLLQTLLLQHQRSGTPLSAAERADATAAIEHSDNEAGYRLFLDVGGNTAFTAGLRALGMRHTTPGATDPTFTRTSGRDALSALRALTPAGPLDAASRRYVLDLMRHVEADQRWGVGVVADHGTAFANKNGWLSVDDDNPVGEDDDGRWIVTSLGIVTVHGQRVLMAVLSQHNASFDDGVRLVQRLARLLARAVA